MKWLPTWPARDWRAMIALLASVAGAAVLTWFAFYLVNMLDAYAGRLISELIRDPKARSEVGVVLVVVIKTLAWGLKLLLAGIVVVLLSLGLAINRRTLKLSRSGFEASGGDDVGEAADKVAEAATNKADEIKEEVRP